MRLKITVTGTVQGVGFRPFVYRLANQLKLKGYVLNNLSGVTIEVEGDEPLLKEFLLRLEKEKPPISRIYSLEYKFLDEIGYNSFEIRKSKRDSEFKVLIMPDIATCDDCLKELFNPDDRRYRYPFINCTNCGPRYTIIEKLPYDRKNTTMKIFKMCSQCEKEYNDPTNRRFHAQPNACPLCGPQIFLTNTSGETIANGEEALRETVKALKRGKIIAVKGLGGFHLLCDATNSESVKELRRRKNREEKPLAVMVPNLDWARKVAVVSPLEERALNSIEKPIVILRKTSRCNHILSKELSPENETVGLFLPYTPLHHLILREFSKPVVATSANITDDPIAKDNDEALKRLSGIADLFLMHDRPIKRRCDDSVVAVISSRQVPIRRSRGFAPLPITVPFEFEKPVLALGPYMKNTIAIGIEDKIFLSQHIGDIDTPLAMEFYKETVKDLLSLLQVEPEIVVCDKHPNYYTTKFGKEHFSDRLIQVQHHHSHIVSCMAENEIPLNEDVIGFSFDGTGYGEDGTIWGGEVLIANCREFKRVYNLKTFPLPGGDKAVKEPFRVALSLSTLANLELPESFLKRQDRKKLAFIEQMIEKNVNCPLTSSMGRLFDGISSILGIKDVVSYHAQAAVMLEQTALRCETQKAYKFHIGNGIIDWTELISSIVNDVKDGKPKEIIARKFHNAVSNMVLEVSLKLREETGINKVVLSGGVFQNRLLTESCLKMLNEENFNVYIHQLVPTNDGGISSGQAVIGYFNSIS